MSAQPNKAIEWNHRGLELARSGRFAESEACFRRAVEIDPDLLSGQTNLGAALVHLGKFADAEHALREAIRLNGEDSLALHNLGIALQRNRRPRDALPFFDRAIAAQPNFPDAYNNRGLALLETGRADDAVADFKRSLQQDPAAANAASNLGNAYLKLGRRDEAATSYRQAIAIRPTFAEAWYNLGTLLNSIGRQDEAMKCFERTISLNPGFGSAYLNLGVGLALQNRFNEAIGQFGKALQLDPTNALARAQRMHFLARQCDWDALAPEMRLLSQLGIEGGIVPPFALLSFEDVPLRHSQRSKKFAAQTYPTTAPLLPRPPARPKRLKIGYFSYDYTEHAVMQLAIGLFEAHDRERFELHAFSYGPPKANAMRRRLESAFDRFTDVSTLSDDAIAALSREAATDVAVDLQGYTGGSRLGIFAHRAAPLQITFLGYPGTTGAPFIDYMVADAIVCPPHWRQAYVEKLIVLPDCYQPNGRRILADKAPTRAEAGLPEEAFVFCCFNNSYKIGPCEFDIWARLLKEVDGSVLWLLAPAPEVERNLRSQAERRGVPVDRIVFAPPVPSPTHLSRHVLADLFLDTFAYNAHTTASDALAAGLPLVTKIGDGFPARVAASILTAAGIPELVTRSEGEYEALALALARDPKRLGTIRDRLEAEIDNSALFDAARFARAIEAGYDEAFDRLVKGKAAEDIQVARS